MPVNVNASAGRDFERLIRITADTLRSTTEMLRDGEIDTAAWHSMMAEEVKLAHTTAAAAAFPDHDELPEDDAQELAGLIQTQLEFLHAWAQELQSNPQSASPVRATMYAGALRGTHAHFINRHARSQGFTHERRVLHPAEHCSGCVALAAQGWQPIGTLPPIGSQQCLTNCKCRFEYRSGEFSRSPEEPGAASEPENSPEPASYRRDPKDPDPITRAFLDRIKPVSRSDSLSPQRPGEAIDPDPEAEMAIPSPMPRIPLPDLIQSSNYSCGAVCLESIARYFGVGPASEEDFIHLVQSDPDLGTPPPNIIQAAEDLGLVVSEHHNLSLRDLFHFLDAGQPVLCVIQAWGSPERYAQEQSGHYVVAIDYDGSNLYFMDPMLNGVRGILPFQTFLNRWHDTDASGIHYVRYGIAFSKPDRSTVIFSVVELLEPGTIDFARVPSGYRVQRTGGQHFGRRRAAAKAGLASVADAMHNRGPARIPGQPRPTPPPSQPEQPNVQDAQKSMDPVAAGLRVQGADTGWTPGQKWTEKEAALHPREGGKFVSKPGGGQYAEQMKRNLTEKEFAGQKIKTIHGEHLTEHDHKTAAEAHAIVAKKHAKAGNHELAAAHEAAAKHHGLLAESKRDQASRQTPAPVPHLPSPPKAEPAKPAESAAKAKARQQYDQNVVEKEFAGQKIRTIDGSSLTKEDRERATKAHLDLSKKYQNTNQNLARAHEEAAKYHKEHTGEGRIGTEQVRERSDKVLNDWLGNNQKLDYDTTKGDPFLTDLSKSLGHNALPQVVDEAEMDKLIASGSPELFRGVVKSEFADQFKTGDLFCGSGVYGAGTYMAQDVPDKNGNIERGSGHRTALSYTGDRNTDEDHSRVMRITLKKDAKILQGEEYDKLVDQHQAELKANEKAIRSMSDGPEKKAMIRRNQIISDFGRYAAMHGYDGLKDLHVVVFNRGAVIVQKEPAKPPGR